MKRPSRPVRPGPLARCVKALKRLVTGNPRRDDLDLTPSAALPGLDERTARVNWHRATPTEQGQ